MKHEPRGKGQSHPRCIHEGFLKYSDLTAWGRVIHILKCNTMYLARYQSMKIPVSFQTAYARADKQILVDSGAMDNFIHPQLIRRLVLGTQKLERSRKIWNIDGTNNKASRITEYVDCYVTAGTFTRRGLSSTAKTLRSLVRWFEVLSTKSKKRT